MMIFACFRVGFITSTHVNVSDFLTVLMSPCYSCTNNDLRYGQIKRSI